MWKISRRQCIEFGQMTVLAAVAATLYYRNFHWATAALLLITLTILAPRLFYPPAVLWFVCLKILGEINIRLLLTLVFVLVVVPVGWWRKLRGRDSLQLRRFKETTDSVMTRRDHTYTKEDLRHTF